MQFHGILLQAMDRIHHGIPTLQLICTRLQQINSRLQQINTRLLHLLQDIGHLCLLPRLGTARVSLKKKLKADISGNFGTTFWLSLTSTSRDFPWLIHQSGFTALFLLSFYLWNSPPPLQICLHGYWRLLFISLISGLQKPRMLKSWISSRCGICRQFGSCLQTYHV